ncbi:hypothetical protein [Streptomyces sp. NBC_00063]|uniref:hypothetical protein n=1 Tax=Streptomyces sp. NBC_00063 TaxID=2975638 RepID=UPI0022506855|nr:hypothetical protein [Streptomyces sp. NBC_00063]MCX5441237.1 hypothetical protein [Streptomyces sp. NBC_00063]
MTTLHSVVLSGELDDLGNSWIGMLKDWATQGLAVVLLLIVLYVLITRFSLKAGVGALLLMVLALGIYQARQDLADKVEDEVKNPAKGAAQLRVPYQPGGETLPGPGQVAS